MIDARYSAAAFARLGPNTTEAAQLSHALSSEIRAQVQGAVEGVLRRMVEQLRGMGHDLQEGDLEFGLNHSGYSFTPASPLPPDGWLAFYFETTAIVLYAGADAESAVIAPEPEPGSHADPYR